MTYDTQPIGSTQKQMLAIIKERKEISFKELLKVLGREPRKSMSLYDSLYSLCDRGVIDVRLPKGHKRNGKYAVFIKDYIPYIPKKEREPTSYELKERVVRDIIDRLYTIKKEEKTLKLLDATLKLSNSIGGLGSIDDLYRSVNSVYLRRDDI